MQFFLSNNTQNLHDRICIKVFLQNLFCSIIHVQKEVVVDVEW
jgi:hypothetical protein